MSTFWNVTLGRSELEHALFEVHKVAFDQDFVLFEIIKERVPKIILGREDKIRDI